MLIRIDDVVLNTDEISSMLEVKSFTFGIETCIMMKDGTEYSFRRSLDSIQRLIEKGDS